MPDNNADFGILIVSLLAFLAAGAVSFASTPLVRMLAEKIGAIDVPRDARRMHKKPIPRLGGLAIFFGFLFAILLFGRIDHQTRGILLGAGGLVRAYTKGAKIAVDAAGKSMKRVWTAVYVPCPYPFYERVKLEAAAFGGILRRTDFGAEVELELLFPEGQVSAFLEKLTDLSSGTVEGMETGQEYRAFPVETT